MTDKATTMLNAAYHHANYLLAQQLQEEGKYSAAAAQFLHYQQLFQDGKYADKALLLAGENYYRAGKNDAAIDSHNLLVDNSPV